MRQETLNQSRGAEKLITLLAHMDFCMQNQGRGAALGPCMVLEVNRMSSIINTIISKFTATITITCRHQTSQPRLRLATRKQVLLMPG